MRPAMPLVRTSSRGPRGPRIVLGASGGAARRRPATLRWAALLAASALAWAGLPASAQELPPAVADSAGNATGKPIIVWRTAVPLLRTGKVMDVGFANPGLNIIAPGEMAWLLDAASGGLVAVAAKPIAGTAAAGEEMGRRGTGLLRSPVAFYAGFGVQHVLEQGGRLVVLRSGWVDSLDAGAGATGPERDIVVGPGGLIYVLAGSEVRVFADPPSPVPLITIHLAPKLLPVTAIALSCAGDLYVAGTGQLALGVYAMDSTGQFRLTRSRTARELGVEHVGGVALNPALLLPYETREGWVAQDRFTILADTARQRLVALESATLAPLGSCDLAAEVPGASPGRLDVSNRGQIAFADPASGIAYALPARVFGSLIESATIRWRSIESDTTTSGGSGAP